MVTVKSNRDNDLPVDDVTGFSISLELEVHVSEDSGWKILDVISC